MTTTPSLIERLRSRTEFWSTDGGVRWYASSNPDTDCAEAAAEIERLTAERDTLKAELAALKASQEPVAHLKFWAYQRNLGDGNVDHDTGFEVCQAGEIGDDKSPAFPVFAAPVPAATSELTRALEWIEEAVMLVGCESWSAALENEGRAILAAAKETK